MNFLLTVFLLSGCFVYAGGTKRVSYLDRKCGNDLSNLWLDVILVVDNSRVVQNMNEVIESISDVFENGTRIGTSDINPKTTRVSLITYNKDAEIIADLNRYQSFNELNDSISLNLFNLSTHNESFLYKGLEAASDVLKNSSKANERIQYKKVILIFSSGEENEISSIPILNRLKADGITIIMVDGLGNKNNTVKTSDLISTETWKFSIHDVDLVENIQNALLQANCFCLNGWIQLRNSYSDMNSYRYSTCFYLNSLPSVWKAARLSCRNQCENGYLVNEYDINKHNFILETLKNSSLFHSPYNYHIGLSYSNGDWNWEQPNGNSLRSLKEQEWMNWKKGFPLVSSTQTVVYNVEDNNGETFWENTNSMKEAHYYVCEVHSCDTDTYCRNVD